MGKVQDNKQQKEQKLFDAAFQLFTTQGIAKTSIADIAAHSGIAKGTFYLYFKDKYDIQRKLIARKSEQIFGHALEYSGYENCTNFADCMIAVLDDVLAQLQKDKVLLRFINKNLSWGIFHQALDPDSEDYLAVIQSALDLTGEQVENLYLLLYTVIELVGSTCPSVILDQDPVSMEEYLPYLHRAIRAILEQFRVNKVTDVQADACQQENT